MNNPEQIPETVQPGEILAAVQLCPFGNFPGEKTLQVCDRAAFEQLIADWRANGSNAVSRGDVGIIGFRYGDEKGGIAHFAGRTDTLHNLSETIVRGEAGNTYQDGQKLNITHGPYTAVLTLTNDPAKSDRPKQWILTAFGPEDKKGNH